MPSFGFGGLFNTEGWKFKRSKELVDEEKKIAQREFIEVENDDAAEVIDSAFVNRSLVGTEQGFQNQSEYINEYRAMSLHPEVYNAVDDIVNQTISCDDNEVPVKVDLSNVDYPDGLKSKINDEFETVCRLMKLNVTAYEKFKQFYVDGRLVYQVIIDTDKPKDGIKKLVLLDPRSVKKVKAVTREPDPVTRIEKIIGVEEYYIYNGQFSFDNTENRSASGIGRPVNMTAGRVAQQIKIPVDNLVLVHSGIVSPENNIIMSHLEMARKALTNLKQMEDAMVIYRITRAPERRVFMIDVGNLPAKASAQYVQGLMNQYRKKLTYDPNTGKMGGQGHQMSIMEDFWLPRKDGARGTEITTLPAGQNLDQIDDVLYFRKNLYRSLNVPISRLENSGAALIFGGQQGQTPEEWKFQLFINKCRRRFNGVFNELLKRQLILKNICTEQDWIETIEPFLNYIYSADGRLKKKEETQEFIDQAAALNGVKELEGKYFSRKTIMQKLFNMSEEDMKEEKEQIEKEVTEGLYPDPNIARDPTGLPITDENGTPLDINTVPKLPKLPVLPSDKSQKDDDEDDTPATKKTTTTPNKQDN
jgi:hypothetical protein